MSRVKLRDALGVVASVLLLSTPATAQPAMAPASPPAAVMAEAWWPGPPLIGTILDHRDALGLTASQVETLERLGLDLVRGAIRRQADLMIAQFDLDVLLDQDPAQAVDAATAETRLREIERIRTDVQLALIRGVEAAKAQLTAEQRARLTALLAGTAAQSETDPRALARRDGRTPPGGAGSRRQPHRDLGRHDHGRIGIRPWPFWWQPYWYYVPPPVIVPEPPVYVEPPGQLFWYYCRSAGAYYPYVSSCPQPWVLVPATPR